MLPEQMVKDGAILFMDPLHLVDVLGHSLHADEGVHEMLMFLSFRRRHVLQLLQEQRVFQYPLDWLDQIGLQGSGLLPFGVAGH